MAESLLTMQNVSRTFPTKRGNYTAVQKIDLDIHPGEVVSIIGHSGCGKSTILSMMAGLDKPTGGEALFDGKPIAGPGPERAMVFQHHALFPWLSVWDNVYQTLDAVRPEASKEEKREIVSKALNLVGLSEHIHKRPGQISGGMKQRTAIARAFVVRPKLLLLDEPFGALDALTRASLQDEFANLWDYQRAFDSVVIVTHDIDEAILLSDRVVIMSNGPGATIASEVLVSLFRPRERRAIVHMPEYIDLKDGLLYLLARNGKADSDEKTTSLSTP